MDRFRINQSKKNVKLDQIRFFQVSNPNCNGLSKKFFSTTKNFIITPILSLMVKKKSVWPRTRKKNTFPLYKVKNYLVQSMVSFFFISDDNVETKFLIKKLDWPIMHTHTMAFNWKHLRNCIVHRSNHFFSVWKKNLFHIYYNYYYYMTIITIYSFRYTKRWILIFLFSFCFR